MGGNCVSSCPFPICDFISCKKSLLGYNLIGLGLQVNFQNGSGNFFTDPHTFGLEVLGWVCYWCAQAGSSKYGRE